MINPGKQVLFRHDVLCEISKKQFDHVLSHTLKQIMHYLKWIVITNMEIVQWIKGRFFFFKPYSELNRGFSGRDWQCISNISFPWRITLGSFPPYTVWQSFFSIKQRRQKWHLLNDSLNCVHQELCASLDYLQWSVKLYNISAYQKMEVLAHGFPFFF